MIEELARMRGQRAEGEQSGAEGDESSQRGMYKRGERERRVVGKN